MPEQLRPLFALRPDLLHDLFFAPAAPQLHAQIADSVWRKTWQIHCQHAGSGEAVVRYLARYVFRTAISDERILAADDQGVTFQYVDSDTRQPGVSRFSTEEFMRRYLQHVLPPGQHRVRYFGWMHPGARARRRLVESLLQTVIVVQPRPPAPPPWHLQCKQCGAFALVQIGRIKRGASNPFCPPTTGPPLERCA